MGRQHVERRRSGILVALLRDARGSTLAMMAAMLLPMTLLAGSAVDFARVYMVQTRLQQACDAGALAARKEMTSDGVSTLTQDAIDRGNAFFTNNFPTGWMQTTEVAFTPTLTSDEQVQASATATVPFSIMKMIGIASQSVTASCRARFDVADTDVIFVLDTTGSMACAPADSDSTCSSYTNNATVQSYTRPSGSGMPGYAGTTGYYVTEKSNSRIAALRAAVLSFYDTFAANADPSTHIRYGFVTYTSSVNVGKAITDINPGYMVGGGSNGTTTWDYDTRWVTGDYQIGSTTTSTISATTASNCNAQAGRTPAAQPGNPYTYSTSTQTAVVKTSSFNTSTNVCTVTSKTYGPVWTYDEHPQEVASLVAGNTITDPTRVDGSTTSWQGCIEERDTSTSSTFSSTSLPYDLDPDLVPNNDNTRWRPMLEDLVWYRNWSSGITSTGSATSNGDNSWVPVSDPYFSKAGFTSCGKPASRLAVMTRAQVAAYVNAADFKPKGGTYHDVGMIWGTRLISPTGPWAGDTAKWSGSIAAPNRVIVFLTDGDMAPSGYIYGQYATEYYQGRVSGSTSTSQSTLTSRHNARFLAACQAAKDRNIDIWTVQIDTSASSTMQTCATLPTQALFSTSGSDLAAKFASIAQHLAMLRITQ